MPRPGFVLDVDRSTPPLLFWHGEGFRLERLPAERTRVIYPPEPVEPLKDPNEAIRHALLHPLGDSKPLPELLFPGMKLTIAFDDISLPLPPMQRPDVRQRVIEAVLDLAAEAGVDDVHLIAALALHRRMTEPELRHAVGDRVYDAFAPSGHLYNMDAGVKIFQIEPALNTDTFPPPFDFLMKREWEWSAKDRTVFLGSSKSLARTPNRLARQIFHSIKAPHAMTSVQAGEVDAVHDE